MMVDLYEKEPLQVHIDPKSTNVEKFSPASNNRATNGSVNIEQGQITTMIYSEVTNACTTLDSGVF